MSHAKLRDLVPTVDSNALVRQSLEPSPRYSIYDILVGLTLQSNNSASTDFNRLLLKHPEVQKITGTFHFPGRGQNLTPVIELEHIKSLLKLILSGKRMPIKDKRIACGDATYIPSRSYVECEVHAGLMKMFHRFDPKLQYTVNAGGLTYHLDMYFPNEKVAVECDEDGHQSYDNIKDAARTEYVSEHLGCTWIRYNPFSSNFDVFELARIIMEVLLCKAEAESACKAEVESAARIAEAGVRSLELQLEIMKFTVYDKKGKTKQL